MYKNNTGRSWALWARRPANMDNAVLREGRKRAAAEQELTDTIATIKALEKRQLTARERRETLEKELNEVAGTYESAATEEQRADLLKRWEALRKECRAAMYKEAELGGQLRDERDTLGVIRQRLK